MPRVVPTDVNKFIDQTVPIDATPFVSDGTVGHLAVVIDLLAHVPDELLELDSASFTALMAARSQLKSAINGFERKTLRDKSFRSADPLVPMVAYGNLTPLAVIRRELAKCPDAVPPVNSPDLAFIKNDTALRIALRNDLASTAPCLARAEWKGATVLAGSVLEALLLWALDLRKTDLPSAINTLDGTGAFQTRGKPSANKLDDWKLWQFILVAKHLKEIEDPTATAAGQLREFRNLIHPGAAKRTQQACNRRTAHIAYGALQLTIDDLAKGHP